MSKGRIRAKSSKGKRWKKGHSGSSNPETNKHRLAAKGKFGNHLAHAHAQPSEGPPLTSEALAAHHRRQEERGATAMDRDGDVVFEQEQEEEEDGETIRSERRDSASTAGTASAYSLIDSALPVFGNVRRLWNSPLESHREICAVLAAISEVVKEKDGKDTETEYFCALVSGLESSTEIKSITAISYLLSLVMLKVPQEILQTAYNTACKVLFSVLTKFQTSDSTALLKSLVSSLTALLSAQSVSVWADGYTQRVFQMLLNFTVHSKPKLRKAAQVGVVSLLIEGDPRDSKLKFHPSARQTFKHCQLILRQKGSAETPMLHMLGMLKDCLANFPTDMVKSLCEDILKLMTLGNSLVRTTCLHALNGLFGSVVGPQGLTPELNGKLVSALYDHQPGLMDAQMLQAWLTVMQSAHTKLMSVDEGLCLAHLPHFFNTCVLCLLADKDLVTKTASKTMESLLRVCIGPYLTSSSRCKEAGSSDVQSHIQKMFRVVESALKYKYQSSWALVLKVLAAFYEVAGRQCHKFMTKSLVSLCELRSVPSFPHMMELDAAFGAAVRSMGPRVVLTAVPLLLDEENEKMDFPRSWILPVLKDHVRETELVYFVDSLLPLAAKLRAKGQQSKNALEAKLYDTLQNQIWALLPGFCTDPTDLKTAFHSIARLLGTALTGRPDLRNTVCLALRLLVERNRAIVESREILSRYSKNYLPILFNLYTTPPQDPATTTTTTTTTVATQQGSNDRGPPLAAAAAQKPSSSSSSSSSSSPTLPPSDPVLECIKAYTSITSQELLDNFFDKILLKLREENLLLQIRCQLLDLTQCFVAFVSESSLETLFSITTPLLDPRLKCLVCIVEQLGPDNAEFLGVIIPEVILCLKEVNEKSRNLAIQLIVKMGYASQHCFQKTPEESIKEYFVLVLAGLAGSNFMVSATLLALAKLVYEFHDLLGTELISKLLSSTLAFLSAKSREVVRATLQFIKIVIGVLSSNDLLTHLENLVSSILNWSEDSRNHFRLKAKVIFERLIRKFGYHTVSSVVPEKHKKLVANIHKTVERQRRKKSKATGSEERGEDNNQETKMSKRFHKPSYDELLHNMDSSDDEESKSIEKRKLKKKARAAVRDTGRATMGHAWLREGAGDDPLNFLDQTAISRVVATRPSNTSKKRSAGLTFQTAVDGRPIIEEEGAEKMNGTELSEMEMDTDTATENRKRAAPIDDDDNDEQLNMGSGIHRKNPNQGDYDYGAEYKAKKAKGDVKRPGMPDPYAYLPLNRQKLNKRKSAKLSGQFSGLMRKGSHRGAQQQTHKRK